MTRAEGLNKVTSYILDGNFDEADRLVDWLSDQHMITWKEAYQMKKRPFMPVIRRNR